MANPIIYIFLNKSLHMSAGKAAAQAAHAVAMVRPNQEAAKLWDNAPHKTIIVLEARDELHMNSIAVYLAQRDYQTELIVDEGANEIDPHTMTALATGILDKDDENVVKTFSTFKLYRDFVKVTTEFER